MTAHIQRVTRPVLVFLTLLITAGCGHLVYLDHAQDAFNQAATLENDTRMAEAGMPQVGVDENWQQAATPSAKAISNETPEAYYTLAYGNVNKALQRKGELKKNGVLASAFTIKALSGWKLGNTTEAEEAAKDALEAMRLPGQVRLPRDEAVMKAMPALLATDRAYANYLILDSLNFVDKIRLGQFADAEAAQSAYRQAKDIYMMPGGMPPNMEAFQQAKTTPGITSGVRFYLLTSQLGATKTWTQSHDRLSSIFHNLFDPTSENESWISGVASWKQEEQAWLQENLCQYQRTRDDLLRQLDQLMEQMEKEEAIAGNDRNRIQETWQSWLVDHSEACSQ